MFYFEPISELNEGFLSTWSNQFRTIKKLRHISLWYTAQENFVMRRTSDTHKTVWKYV